jgi:hypothetical protein
MRDWLTNDAQRARARKKKTMGERLQRKQTEAAKLH